MFTFPMTMMAPTSTLLNGLIAWWAMDEASGNRADSHTNGLNLTATGSPPSAVGKLNNAVDLQNTASSTAVDYLSSSSSSLKFGDEDFSVAGWVRIDVAATEDGICTVYDPSTNNRGYAIYFAIQGSDYVLRGLISSDGIGFTGVNSSDTVSPGTWYFVQFYHDASANEIGVALNNGAFSTASHSGGAFPSTSASFTVGAFGNLARALDGRVDELAVWDRVLTADEWTELYNSGNGVEYPG